MTRRLECSIGIGTIIGPMTTTITVSVPATNFPATKPLFWFQET